MVAHLKLNLARSDWSGDWSVEDGEVWLGVRVVVAQCWRHCPIGANFLTEGLAVLVSAKVRERGGERVKVKMFRVSSLPFTTHIGQARVETRTHVSVLGTGHRSVVEWKERASTLKVTAHAEPMNQHL
jgi:hypothetical protein